MPNPLCIARCSLSQSVSLESCLLAARRHILISSLLWMHRRLIELSCQPYTKCTACVATLKRRFRFKDFRQTMGLVNQVAEIAHQENHHPSLQVGFNTCEVHFSTHSCRGLSQNDFICAAKVDRWLLMQEEKIQANKQMKTEHTRYGFVVYVPSGHLEPVKQAMFEAGAGCIGDYDRCAWQISGQGQFRPLSGSQPFLGAQGALETVEEYRVEMVCKSDAVKSVIAALKAAHPYEQPAYWVLRLEDF